MSYGVECGGEDAGLFRKLAQQVFPSCLDAGAVGHNGSATHRFWLIPGSAGLRWILPSSARAGRRALMSWRPYTLLSRLQWSLLLAAYKTKLLGFMPGVTKGELVIETGADWQNLGWKSNEPPIVAFYIGTPGPTRKAAAILVDRTSLNPVGVAKLPLADRAAGAILREAEMLDALAKKIPGLAPRLMHVNIDKGITLQEAVIGKPSGRKFTAAHVGLLRKLHAKGDMTSLAEQADTLRERAGRLRQVDKETMRLIARVLVDIGRETRPLLATWGHGDFAPWNLKWETRKRLRAIDWEHAIYPSLPLFDVLHFFYIQDYLFKAKTSGLTSVFLNAHAAAYIKELSLGKQDVVNTAILYLCGSLLGSIEDGAHDREAFCLREITSCLGATV